MNPAPLNHHSSVCPSDPPAGVHSQLALWMAATLTGMVTAVLLARRQSFQKLIATTGSGKRAVRKPSLGQSLPMLSTAIVGSNKSTVQAVLGPPRSVAIEGIGVVANPQLAFWQAQTWYYPLLNKAEMAFAISFNDDLATAVEFFTAPRLAR